MTTEWESRFQLQNGGWSEWSPVAPGQCDGRKKPYAHYSGNVYFEFRPKETTTQPEPIKKVVMVDPTHTYFGTWDGPRWAGMERLIRHAAAATRLQVNSLQVEKRWLTESGFYQVTGLSHSIDAFKSIIRQSIEQWEKS